MKKFTKFLVSGLLIVGGLYGISQHTNNETQVAEAAEEVKWSVVGSFNGWDTTDENYIMTYVEENSRYEIIMDFTEGDTFKVVKNQNWNDLVLGWHDYAYEENNLGTYLKKAATDGNFEVRATGQYLLYFYDKSNVEGHEVWAGDLGIEPHSHIPHFLEFTAKANSVDYGEGEPKGIHFYSALIEQNNHKAEKNENGLYHVGFEFDFYKEVEKEVEKLYLVPSTNWKKDEARFAAYFFGNGEKWVSMTDSNGDGVYEVLPQEGYPSVIFCRMNPSTTANNWDNKWNQTSNLTVPTNGTNTYTVKEETWDKGGGTWSTRANEKELVVDKYLTKRYTLKSVVESVKISQTESIDLSDSDTYLTYFEIILTDIPAENLKVFVRPAYAYKETETSTEYLTEYGSYASFDLENGLLKAE